MIERLKVNGKEIILVGVAHISKGSIEEVKEVILYEKPEAVALELDELRARKLLGDRTLSNLNVIELIRSGRTLEMLALAFFSTMQKKIGKSLNIKPGSEMLEAIKSAQQINANIFYVDRPLDITFRRMFSKITLREKVRFVYELISSFFTSVEISQEDIERLKSEDMLSFVLESLAANYPSVKKILLDERDLYIAESVKRINAKKIVVVVGAAHMRGVKRTLLSKRRVSLKYLSKCPSKRKQFNLIKYLIPMLFISVILLGIFMRGAEFILKWFSIWFLLNASFAALGAILARAHWKSILAAFFAAPFTSLHPLLAAGWFAALVELKEKPFTISDIERLPEIDSLNEFLNNRVIHILLVAAFVNLFSFIASILSFLQIPLLL